MTVRNCILAAAAAIALISSARALAGAPDMYEVSSPDYRITARLMTSGALRYAVEFLGKPVVLESPLGLAFRDGAPLTSGFRVVEATRRAVRSAWENPLGKRRHVVENGSELRVALEESSAPHRRLDLLFRLYNDALAFRYVLPKQQTLDHFILTREESAFRFAGDPTVWAANYGGYASSQESEFHKSTVSALSSQQPYGTPLLVHARPDCFVAITEADLQDWAGLYLSGGSSDSGEKLAETPVMRGGDAARKIDVSVAGKQQLRLVVGDGGDDFTFDHADWGDARLIAADGKMVYLSALRPLSASQGYGTLQSDRSVGGGPLRIGDQTYAHGLGSHSKGEIVYDLGERYSRFQAEVGIDRETENKGSATFAVYARAAQRGGSAGLAARLSPRRDGQGLVVGQTPCRSPWRVLLIGRTAGDLAESDAIVNLSEPCAIGDASWVKPGKCAWDNWWSGDVKMDTPTQKEFVQFAGEMGFPYQLVDWQWYGAFSTPDSDITHINPNLDMPELLRFAKERGVRLFVWLHSNDVDRFLKSGRLDEAFALYERWGLAGVKIDFMDRDDQEMVNWYHTIIKMTAKHHLMVDFHGAYKPTGTQRTYPNQITREGVMGEEYDKFSNRVTPEHDCTLPFTRFLAGPADYTPGGFLNRSRDRWKQTLPTQVQGTRGHELAKFVIFDSPLTVLCDHPRNYRDQPGLTLLRDVPTVWDDTRYLDGFPGEFVVTARRSGREWYVAGMTNWDPRTVQVPLKLLGPGLYIARIYQDAPDADAEAEHLTIKTQEVRAGDTLTIRMASGGGFAIRLTPKP